MTLEDYAIKLKEELGMDLDVERIEMCQRTYRGEQEKHMTDIREIVETLENAGHTNAAEYLKSRIS